MPTAIKDPRPHPKAVPPPFTDLLEVMEPIKHFFFLADILPTNRNDKWYGESLHPRAFYCM
jgi:hypothetical protein